jgi:hypothetical protein
MAAKVSKDERSMMNFLCELSILEPPDGRPETRPNCAGVEQYGPVTRTDAVDIDLNEIVAAAIGCDLTRNGSADRQRKPIDSHGTAATTSRAAKTAPR